MQSIRTINPLLRAVAVISAVAVLAAGVTFAFLTSTATLTGNTLSSATAGLLVDGSDGDTVATSSEPGFAFNNLLPGAAYGSGQTLRLENNGTAQLDVTVSAGAGLATGTIDRNEVFVKFTNQTTPGFAEYTLAQLESAGRNMPNISTGVPGFLDFPLTTAFTMQVRLGASAVTGSSASIGSFPLVFTGTSF